MKLRIVKLTNTYDNSTTYKIQQKFLWYWKDFISRRFVDYASAESHLQTIKSIYADEKLEVIKEF